jgi:hypothetical protein
MVRRLCIIVGLLVCALLTGTSRAAETFKMANGEEMVGEMLLSTANDEKVQIKVGEGDYKQVPWTSFSQDELKRLARNPKVAPFVEPFIEVTSEEKLKRTEVNLKPPERLERAPRRSLLGAMSSTVLGFFILFLLYAANVYAAYEIAVFRARPVPLVCGVAAVAPLVGPLIFLSLPTVLPPSEETAVLAPPAEAGAAAAVAASGEAVPDDINPMRADGAVHPTALRLAHIETEPEAKPSLPPTVTYQRGQFTFNRRFIETKFPSFFGIVRREADKDMVMVIKAARGEYMAERISRVAANDFHVQIREGPATVEVMVPYQEIQQIQVKHKDAK